MLGVKTRLNSLEDQQLVSYSLVLPFFFLGLGRGINMNAHAEWLNHERRGRSAEWFNLL